MNNFNLLFNKIKLINERFKELPLLKGENFNLFSILDRRTHEVKTHSAMIAELLNPKGSHGMGDEFLKLFLNHLNKEIIAFDRQFPFQELHNTVVHVEYYIGAINEDKTEGGRIDIFLKNKDFNICIENKVYAGDQDLQLIRYNNYMKDLKNPLLLYLTLEGVEPSENSTTTDKQDLSLRQNADYHNISYKYDILKWLQECLKSSVSFPILRESINQYIILIKSLTNQLTSAIMEEKVKNAILSDLSTAETIKNNFDAAIESVANKFRDAVLSKLQVDYQNAEKINAHSQLRSIFIPASKGRLGIESFNGKSIFRDQELFIGLLVFSEEENRWKWENREKIFSKEELFQNLQGFEKGNHSGVDKVVEKIKTYIKERKVEIK